MANAVLTAPHFHNEAAAFEYVEALLWPKGPVCPHVHPTTGVVCASLPQRIGKLVGVRTKPSKKNPQGIVRHGLYKCYHCRGQFTVRKGTIFEETQLALHLWLQVIHLMCASKKGIATRQVQRLLNCSMQTAWHLTHRIREIMKPGTANDVPPMGGEGVTVEADEVYLGAKAGKKKNRRPVEKMAVMTLVERDGAARSFRIPTVRAENVRKVLSNTKPGTHLMTDDARVYQDSPAHVASHGRIGHSYGEYVKGNIHTNTVEGYFSTLRRGLEGTYQSVSEAHLARYLVEFDYRYSNRERLGVDDATRAKLAVRNAKGRRLTYEILG